MSPYCLRYIHKNKINIEVSVYLEHMFYTAFAHVRRVLHGKRTTPRGECSPLTWKNGLLGGEN